MSGTVKHAVKHAVKRAAGAVGVFVPHSRPCARILTYHSVGERDHEMNVTPRAFREQMAWLREHANVVSLADAARGTPGVALTFDDGYRDNLTQAAPVLREFGMPATVFIVAGRAGEFLDHDSRHEPARLMSWDEIRVLESMGIAIGAHTLSHPRLSRLMESQQREEIAGCAAMLAEQLNHPIEAFAYPFGSALDYDERSVRIVRETGFSYACSNRYGVNVAERLAPWELRRIWIDRTDTLDTFCRKVRGQLDLLRHLESRPALVARRALNRIAGH